MIQKREKKILFYIFKKKNAEVVMMTMMIVDEGRRTRTKLIFSHFLRNNFILLFISTLHQ